MADTPTPVDPTSNPEVPPTITDTVPVSDVEIKPTEVTANTDPSVSVPESTSVPLTEVATMADSVPPTTDPEVPQPATTTELPTAPPPDEAYLEAQATQQDRWQQAAATNPEGINNNGSVTTDLGNGQKETVNRDGSYSISGADGTTYYDAAGQQTAYTTPTVDGLSTTTTTDGIQYTNYSQGPLTTSTITKDGEPISTTVTYDAGEVKLTSTQVAGGEIVTSASTIVEGDKVAGYTIAEAIQVGDGEIITQTTKTPAYEEFRQTYDANAATNEALTADALKYKQQLAEGLPPDPTQVAYLGEEVATAEATQAALYEAEDGLAAADPLYVSPNTDPQVTNPPLDTTPILDTEVTPTAIVAADNPEVPPDPPITQVPVAQVDTGVQTDQVAAADNPEVPQPSDLPPPIEYVAAEPPTADPIVVAQADTVVTDVPVSDITVEPVTPATDAQIPGNFVYNAQGELVPADSTQGRQITNEQQTLSAVRNTEINTALREYTTSYDPETGRYSVIDATTGQVVADDLSQQQATLDSQNLNAGGEGSIPLPDPVVPGPQIDIAPDPINVVNVNGELVDLNTGAVVGTDQEVFVNVNGINVAAEDIPVQREGDVLVDINSGQEYPIDSESGFVEDNGVYVSPEDIATRNAADLPEGSLVEFTPEGDVVRSPQELAAQQAEIDQAVKNAQAQATLAQQMRQANSGDWRVKLRLAPGANYLYRANDGKGTQAGILQPLAVTDGVVFPYTPQITTAYRANYSTYDLTHSNYRGYFYQSSFVDDIQIQATFTAQDTKEAEYLLAVIHFFRSITKMFYGKDPERGAPPPLVFLQGLGQFQFNLHPCVVAQFNYNLPNDVDYIRARSPNIYNTNLLEKRDRKPAASTSPFISAWERLRAAGNIPKGAVPGVSRSNVPILGTDSPTYVPTKIDMTIILHPIQSRQQVSNNFSLAKYANGDLIKGGTNQPGAFW